MKDRLIEFLRSENKSSAQLAADIGVQASGISHIISGRNNPSLDFVLKMLDKYKFLSSEWLLFAKGSMYKEPKMQTLFDNVFSQSDEKPVLESFKPSSPPEREIVPGDIKITRETSVRPKKQDLSVVKIVWFYDNNTFDEFYPLKKLSEVDPQG